MKTPKHEMENPIHADCPPLTGQIRPVKAQDAEAIADIYNEYILHSTVTFETVPLSAAEMRTRVCEISAVFPYFVYERRGQVWGYCYVHLWKERAAYCHTYETTIYLHPQAQRTGIGVRMMQKLIEACRERDCHALIACITEENEASCRFHQRLGFRCVSHFGQVGRKFGRWLDVADYELLLD